MNELQLTVQVKGGAWVQGPMGIRIKVGLECELHCAVEKLFDYEARHEVVKSKECQYSYFWGQTWSDQVWATALKRHQIKKPRRQKKSTVLRGSAGGH